MATKKPPEEATPTPTEAVKPTTKTYVCHADIRLGDVVYNPGSTVELDPEHKTTKALLLKNKIAVQLTPAAE